MPKLFYILNNMFCFERCNVLKLKNKNKNLKNLLYLPEYWHWLELCKALPYTL